MRRYQKIFALTTCIPNRAIYFVLCTSMSIWAPVEHRDGTHVQPISVAPVVIRSLRGAWDPGGKACHALRRWPGLGRFRVKHFDVPTIVTAAARHAFNLWFWSSSKLSFLGVSHRFAEPPFVQVSFQTLFIALNVLFRDWNILLGVEPRSPRKPCFGIAKSLPFYKVTRAFHKTFIQTCCHGKCTRHDMQHHATNHPRTFQDWLFGWLIGWLMCGRNNQSSQDQKKPMPSVDEIDSCNVQPGSSTTTNGTINEAFFFSGVDRLVLIDQLFPWDIQIDTPAYFSKQAPKSIGFHRSTISEVVFFWGRDVGFEASP